MKKPFRFLSGTAVIAATLLLGVSTTDASEAEKEAFLIGFEEMTIMADFIEENEEAEGALLATVADEEIAIDVLYEFEQIPVLSVEMTKEDVSELKGEESISYIEEDIEVPSHKRFHGALTGFKQQLHIIAGLQGMGCE